MLKYRKGYKETLSVQSASEQERMASMWDCWT